MSEAIKSILDNINLVGTELKQMSEHITCGMAGQGQADTACSPAPQRKDRAMRRSKHVANSIAIHAMRDDRCKQYSRTRK